MKKPLRASAPLPVPALIQDAIAPWVAALRAAAGDACRAIYVHGSALSPHFDRTKSDINLMVILSDFPHPRLEALAGAIAAQARRDKQRITPLVFTAEQLHHSTDVFPVEFLDLLTRRALVHGADVVAELELEGQNLRHQCEWELRSKLVGLRQAFLRAGGKPGVAHELMVRAAGGIAATARGLLALHDVTRAPEDPDELLGAVAESFGVDAAALTVPFAARRAAKPPADAIARERFAAHLAALESLIGKVDELPAD
jgi:hypothetical protein